MQQKYKEKINSSEKTSSVKESASEKTASEIKSARNRKIPAKQYNIERNYMKKVPLESIIAEEISKRMEEKFNKSCE